MTPDDVILPVIEAAVVESKRRAGDWIACRAGCSECCHAAFAITMLDAARLRHGLDGLAPDRRAALVHRARCYTDSIRDTLPGDWSTGLLDRNEEWQDWFFERQRGVACPVLDQESGRCELYDHRPVACRLYGHLIQIGGTQPTACRLCFSSASPADLDACRVRIDPAAIDESELTGGQTIVALALSY